MLQPSSIRIPPWGTCELASSVQTWNCVGPSTASNWSLKLPRGALCAVFRADPGSAHESEPRGGLMSRDRQLA
eukprot:9202423-Alexandrium_andersonii.AAC.1